MDEQNNVAEPKLNLLNLAGGINQLVGLLNKVSDPTTLANLESSGKLTLADIEQLVADVQKVSSDVQALISQVKLVLGE